MINDAVHPLDIVLLMWFLPALLIKSVPIVKISRILLVFSSNRSSARFQQVIGKQTMQSPNGILTIRLLQSFTVGSHCVWFLARPVRRTDRKWKLCSFFVLFSFFFLLWFRNFHSMLSNVWHFELLQMSMASKQVSFVGREAPITSAFKFQCRSEQKKTACKANCGLVGLLSCLDPCTS